MSINEIAFSKIKELTSQVEELKNQVDLIRWENRELSEQRDNLLNSLQTVVNEFDGVDLYCFLPQVTVVPYVVDRAYGGPEEGGWHFTTWTPIAEKAKKMNLGEAMDFTCRANQLTQIFINSKRRDISSVLSEGNIEWGICVGEPEVLPRYRPFYE